MKVYWIVGGAFGGRCFFTTSKEEAQFQVDFRLKECKDSEKWHICEEDIPDEKMGICINELSAVADGSRRIKHRGFLYRTADHPDCSVGMVRKLRSGINHRHGAADDDSCCRSCPYFWTRQELESETDSTGDGRWESSHADWMMMTLRAGQKNGGLK